MNWLTYRKETLQTIMDRDVSVHSKIEARYFPGYKAIMTHYWTHKLYLAGHKGLARILSLRCQRRTGIDIHPGATIGKGFFIDHGAGVVIGETCIIGDNCTLYQGVTLGATGNVAGNRHPILEEGVTVGAGAKIIGRITLGAFSKIGAGAIIVKDVPSGYTMIGPAAHAVKDGSRRIPVLTVAGLKKSIDEEITQLRLDDLVLEQRLEQIEGEEDQEGDSDYGKTDYHDHQRQRVQW